MLQWSNYSFNLAPAPPVLQVPGTFLERPQSNRQARRQPCAHGVLLLTIIAHRGWRYSHERLKARALANPPDSSTALPAATVRPGVELKDVLDDILLFACTAALVTGIVLAAARLLI